MFTIQAPYISPVLSVVLPNPSLGDSAQQSLKTKFGFAMSGRITTTIVRLDFIKLQYSFDKLLRSHVDGLLTLLASYASSDLKVTDYSGVIYKCKLISNPIEFTENVSFYSCQLEFQGTKA